MPKFTVRAYEPDGAFAFGCTLHCAESADAIKRFHGLPLQGKRAELVYGSRVIARQDVPAPEARFDGAASGARASGGRPSSGS